MECCIYVLIIKIGKFSVIIYSSSKTTTTFTSNSKKVNNTVLITLSLHNTVQYFKDSSITYVKKKIPILKLLVTKVGQVNNLGNII